MNILNVPFHRHLQIKQDQRDDYVFCMDEHPQNLNHLGTVHACAQLALAEASSGEFLLKQFPELEGKVIPVIRQTEVKYSTPANGSLSSRVSYANGGTREEYLADFTERNRCIIPLKVELYNKENKRTLSAVFNWFITSI